MSLPQQGQRRSACCAAKARQVLLSYGARHIILFLLLAYLPQIPQRPRRAQRGSLTRPRPQAELLSWRDGTRLQWVLPIAPQKGTCTGLWAQQSDPEHLSRFIVSIGRRSIRACNRPQDATGESLRREARWASGKPCPRSPRRRAWRRPGALRRRVARRAATLSEVHRDRGRRVAIPPAGQSD